MTDKKDVKIVHVTVVDGDFDQIRVLKDQLLKWKENADLPFDIEFLISNDKLELRDAKQLINELYALYKKFEKKVEEQKQAKKGEKDE